MSLTAQFAIVGLFGLMACSFIGILWWLKARYAAKRARFLEQYPLIRDNPVACDLARHFNWVSLDPEAKVIQKILAERTASAGVGATIICVGLIGVPDVAEGPVEPVDIPSGRFWPVRLAFLAGIGALFLIPGGLAMVSLWREELLQWPFLVTLGFFAVVITVFLVNIGSWVGARRRTSIRLASGLIEVRESRRGESNPTVRRYPLEVGTLLIIKKSPIPFGNPQSLTLSRGKYQDVIAVSEMRRHKEFLRQVWNVVLAEPCPTTAA